MKKRKYGGPLVVESGSSEELETSDWIEANLRDPRKDKMEVIDGGPRSLFDKRPVHRRHFGPRKKLNLGPGENMTKPVGDLWKLGDPNNPDLTDTSPNSSPKGVPPGQTTPASQASTASPPDSPKMPPSSPLVVTPRDSPTPQSIEKNIFNYFDSLSTIRQNRLLDILAIRGTVVTTQTIITVEDVFNYFDSLPANGQDGLLRQLTDRVTVESDAGSDPFGLWDSSPSETYCFRKLKF
jgi:hypothetical protein